MQTGQSQEVEIRCRCKVKSDAEPARGMDGNVNNHTYSFATLHNFSAHNSPTPKTSAYLQNEPNLPSIIPGRGFLYLASWCPKMLSTHQHKVFSVFFFFQVLQRNRTNRTHRQYTERDLPWGIGSFSHSLRNNGYQLSGHSLAQLHWCIKWAITGM